MRRRQRPAGAVAVWASPDGSRRFYTRRARQWLIPVFAWFFAALALVGPGPEFGLYNTWQSGVPIAFVVVTASTFVTYGAFRSGVLVEPGWVTNRRMLWTNRVPANDIARFEPPPAYGTVRRTGIRIVLHDGSIISAAAFAKGKVDNDSLGVAECAELNTWLETQRGIHVAPPLY